MLVGTACFALASSEIEQLSDAPVDAVTLKRAYTAGFNAGYSVHTKAGDSKAVVAQKQKADREEKAADEEEKASKEAGKKEPVAAVKSAKGPAKKVAQKALKKAVQEEKKAAEMAKADAEKAAADAGVKAKAKAAEAGAAADKQVTSRHQTSRHHLVPQSVFTF